MKYYIYIENKVVAEVSGMGFAYEVYAKATELAEMIGEIANLVDGESGEVIASSDDWDDYDEDYKEEKDYKEIL